MKQVYLLVRRHSSNIDYYVHIVCMRRARCVLRSRVLQLILDIVTHPGVIECEEYIIFSCSDLCKYLYL